MQLARDFPGEMFRKLRPNNDWDHYRQAFQWDDAELRGARRLVEVPPRAPEGEGRGDRGTPTSASPSAATTWSCRARTPN